MLLQRIIILFLFVLSMMSSYALAGNTKIYTQTSYALAYDPQDATQYLLVMPDAQKIYTHKAGDIASLHEISNDFRTFPSYNNGKLCFSALKSGKARAFDASKMAGKCFDVKFYYAQKEEVGNQMAFMLYYAPKAKLYEGLAGSASSFKMVREGSTVYNAQSITSEDYTDFVFDRVSASFKIGKGSVIVNPNLKGVVNPINGTKLTPDPTTLTDEQLSAVMGIITNFILSSDSSATPSKQELAIEKISKYADSSNDVPTLQDYSDAGVTGVNAANLADINKAVKDTTGTNVDTVVEIQTLVNSVINNVVKNYKLTLKTTEKIAGYEVHLRFTKNTPTSTDIVIKNDFLGTTGRTVNDLGADINNDINEVAFGGFSFGNQDTVDGGEFDILTLKSKDSKSQISIIKKSCVDKDANEISCDIVISNN